MNDELLNDQNNLKESNEKAQTNVCTVCKKDPCVCSREEDETKILDENSGNNEKPIKKERPKISWI